MPYIKNEDRQRYHSILNDLSNRLTNYGLEKPKPGELNYVISTIIWDVFRKNTSYTTGNELVGVLECVKQEFYRKQLADYEDKKEKENGSI